MEAQTGSTQGKFFQDLTTDYFHLIPPLTPTHKVDSYPSDKHHTDLAKLSEINSLAAYWFAFLWKTSFVYIDKNEMRGCWGGRKARFKVGEGNIDLAWGQKFKSGCFGFGLMISYVIYNLLQNSSHELIRVPILL